MNVPHREVHIHCLELRQHQPELARFERLLSADEAERAGLLKSDQARNRFIAGRGLLREILGGYLGVAPEQVQLATGEHGKPFLADWPGNLRFNLSHAGELLLLAVTDGLEVGVDIEQVEPDKPLRNLARLAFSRREQQELFALPSTLQTAAFYRCWTRKEACMKACGRGFSLPSDSFSVSLLDDETPILADCGNQSWQVMDLQVPQGYCAALAVESFQCNCSGHWAIIYLHSKKIGNYP
jgi:4'-phosphopantetheinyl transferase